MGVMLRKGFDLWGLETGAELSPAGRAGNSSSSSTSASLRRSPGPRTTTSPSWKRRRRAPSSSCSSAPTTARTSSSSRATPAGVTAPPPKPSRTPSATTTDLRQGSLQGPRRRAAQQHGGLLQVHGEARTTLEAALPRHIAKMADSVHLFTTVTHTYDLAWLWC
ncbi:serine/arginine repetitive matrix protein 1 [Triticum aestivum]|uniref:serine/arginine repetitive matrix protein 1 n=1 Tax=Triticum aestivum TaxID=4565 RepID=UPI001D01D974|nr:serine/arginine repetitive matrix protein 1-like [Triticum aestivum]